MPDGGRYLFHPPGGGATRRLLEHELIDTVRLKLNPFIQGQGTPLFGPTANNYQLELLATDRYPEGMQIITYGVRY